jgi:pimeloyl-ACP methyl ester carboxylesterase
VQTVDIGDGNRIAYDSIGDGPAIVFIHGALIPDAFAATVGDRSLGELRRITYHRRGYGDSSRPARGLSMQEHAADCAVLLRALGIAHAHVVGHSFGGSVALQLALDWPQLVRTLAVLEPGLFVGGSAAGYRAALAANQRRSREVGAAPVVTEFLAPRFGPDWTQRFPRALYEQAVANAPYCFDHELAAAADWTCDEPELRRIHQPVLAVLGERSEAMWDRFGETHRVLLRTLPRVEGFTLPGATHALQLDSPHAFAVRLSEFLRTQAA